MPEEPNTPPEEPTIDPMAAMVSSLLTDPPEAAPAPTTETPAKEEPVKEEPAKEEPAKEEPAKEEPAKEEPETPEEPELGLDETDKPEGEPEPEEEPIPEKPTSRNDWDILRSSRDRHKQSAEEAKTLLAEREAELATLREKESRLAELERQLPDWEAMEKELAVTRLEATREYKEAIAKPLDVLGNKAELLAKTNESDPDKVYAMLVETDPAAQRTALKELTIGWDEIDRQELWDITKSAREILDKQDQMRENASAAAKEQQTIAAEREKTEKAEARKTYVATTKDVVSKLKDSTPFVELTEGETADDRFAAIERKASEVDFSAQTPRGQAFAAVAALERPYLLKTIAKLQEEAATLRSRVKAENAGKATVGSPEAKPPEPEGEQDFLDAMGVPKPAFSQSLSVTG